VLVVASFPLYAKMTLAKFTPLLLGVRFSGLSSGRTYWAVGLSITALKLKQPSTKDENKTKKAHNRELLTQKMSFFAWWQQTFFTTLTMVIKGGEWLAAFAILYVKFLLVFSFLHLFTLRLRLCCAEIWMKIHTYIYMCASCSSYTFLVSPRAENVYNHITVLCLCAYLFVACSLVFFFYVEQATKNARLDAWAERYFRDGTPFTLYVRTSNFCAPNHKTPYSSWSWQTILWR
jgi:hypothetical protein